MRDPANLPNLLQSFFTTRLMTQRKVSHHTIASYRDTFRLLLQFAQKRLHKAPSQLGLEDLDASLVGAFLEDLENRRHNGTRMRNLRLTAIRSFFRYASLAAPAHSGIIQRVLAIPNQRQRRALVGFLTRPEIEALLAAPNKTTWLGRRDHAFLLTAVQTGLRLSEMTSLRQEDVALSAGGVQHLLTRHVTQARKTCAYLRKKRVSPHVLRHAAAMELLQAGVDRAVIALWLGHESVETTQIYLDADLALKEAVLEKTKPIKSKAGRYRPDDELLAFLNGL